MSKMPPGRWDEIMERDRQCQASHYNFALDLPCTDRPVVHHRLIKGMGGTTDPAVHDPARLVLLCDRHHVEVHAQPAAAYECGLLIRHDT